MKKSILIVFAIAASMIFATSCVKDSGSASSTDTTVTEVSVPTDSTDTTSEITGAPTGYLTCVGEAVGGAHASIFIEDANGDDHEFEYSEIDPDSVETWEEGDEMVVTYVHNPNPEIGDSVISVRHK